MYGTSDQKCTIQYKLPQKTGKDNRCLQKMSGRGIGGKGLGKGGVKRHRKLLRDNI